MEGDLFMVKLRDVLFRVGWDYSARFFAHFLSYRLYYFEQVY